MSTIYADGGWPLAAILTLLLGVLAFVAYRSRWPSNKPQTEPANDSPAPQQNRPAPATPQNRTSGGIMSKLTGRAGKIIGVVIGIVVALFILFHLVDILAWVGNTTFHLLGVKTVEYRTTTQVTQTQTATRTTPGTRAPNEPPCPAWSREQHVCVLTDTTLIRTAPNLPAGLTFCLTPDLDPESAKPEERHWKSIRRVLETGDTMNFDSAHRIGNVIGYELTPAHGRLPIVYWLSDTSPCT